MISSFPIPDPIKLNPSVGNKIFDFSKARVVDKFLSTQHSKSGKVKNVTTSLDGMCRSGLQTL